jgi:hypothetical protein
LFRGRGKGWKQQQRMRRSSLIRIYTLSNFYK